MASNCSDDAKVGRISRLRNGIWDVIETIECSTVRFIAEIASRWLTCLLFEAEHPLAERFQRGTQYIIEELCMRVIEWIAPRIGDW